MSHIVLILMSFQTIYSINYALKFAGLPDRDILTDYSLILIYRKHRRCPLSVVIDA
jgi:hypothetical protein